MDWRTDNPSYLLWLDLAEWIRERWKAMATIDSKEFIDRIIAGNGRIDQDDAPDNPRATRIVEYTNAYGNKAYGVTFPNDNINKYMRESEYIHNPRIIWELSNDRT